MKTKMYWAMTMLVVLTLVAAGCVKSNPHPAEMTVDVTCDEFMAQHHISKEVEVPVNGQLVVTLCSNPTTGFRWLELAQISDPTVLQQTDHSFIPPEEANIVGGAGQEVWTFKALKKGTCNVYIEYSRPWEGGEKAEWTFNATVMVK